LALLISLFRGTVMGQLYQVDGLMVMQLSSGFLFSSMSIWGYRTAHYERHGTAYIQNFGGFGTHVRLALTTAISVYAAWFWAEGVEDGLKIAEDPQCRDVKTWFFHGFPISGGIHIVYIVMTVGTAIFYGIMCIAAVLAFVSNLAGGWKKRPQFETGFSRRELKLIFRVLSVFNIVWIVLCAVLIELTLGENHMLQTLAKYGNVAFPAQLLPLLVGVLSFARVLWLILVDWVDSGDEKAASEDAAHPVHPHRSAYAKTLRGGLRLLPPWNSAKQHRPAGPAGPARPDDRKDLHKPIHYRILVGYLPWLSVFPFWRRELRDIENQLPTKTHDMNTDVRNTDVPLTEEKVSQKLD